MNDRTYRYILIVFWGMILCINIVLCLYNPNVFSGVLVGFVLGGIVIMLIDGSIIKLQDDFINNLIRIERIRLKHKG